jgi:NAD(P)-dependent dehydrogenase (short-subunit alcohol dehydrogenase family)
MVAMSAVLPEEGLEGARVLVTGASRGIGAAAVARFAAAGAQVVGASRSLPAQPQPNVNYLAADLSTDEGAATLAAEVTERLGGIDVLVNNAGAGTTPGPILERTDEAWLEDLTMNLMSAVRLDRRLVPGMVERGSGVVVHLSSIASRLAQGAQISYASAKSALNSYSRGLADEVGPHGVRVVNVLPGFVATEGALAQHQRFADARGVSLEQFQKDLAAQLNVPMRRPGTPEDAAELIVFLASSRAKWLTGAEFRVDGGILPTV